MGNAKTAMDNAKTAMDNADTALKANPTEPTLKTAYDNAKTAYDNAKTAYDNAKKAYDNAIKTEYNGNKTYVPVSGVTYEWQSKTVMKVIVSDSAISGSAYVTLPLGGVKVTGGDASVAIDTSRSKTTATAQKFVLANTSDKIFKVTAGDPTSFYTDSDSKIADLTFDENYLGSLKGDSDSKTIVTLEINDTDFNFYNYPEVSSKDDVFTSGTQLVNVAGKADVIEYKYGYGSTANQPKVYVAMDKKDNGKLYVGFDASSATTPDSNGQVTLKGLRVDCLTKTPDEGDFTIDIKGGDLSNEADNVVVAKVSKFSAYIKMDEDKAKEIVGGRQEEIKFEIGENVENSMVTGREMEVKLVDNGHFDYKWLVNEYYGDADKALTAYKDDFDKDQKSLGDDEYKELAAKLPKAWLTDKIIDNKDDWTVAAKDAKDNAVNKGEHLYVEFDKDDDGKAIVDTLIVFIGKDNDGKLTQNNDEKDKIKFKLKACVPLDKKDNEKVELKATGRAIDNNEVTATAITIKNPLKVETEPVTLKVGLQNQVGGKIVLSETDKEMFQQDGTITINVKDTPAGIKFQEDCKFESSEGIKRVKVDTNKDGTTITFTIKRDSKAAATITIPELHFTVDRTVPEGSYDIEIGGTALDKDGHKLTVKDFIVIGTKNTGDLVNGANGLAAGTVKFVIGESKYTVNDVVFEMSGAKSYIQEPGFTMVPVRYVAEAFGVSKENILANGGVVTIFAGNRTVQLTNNSDVALVNGATVKMATKVVIKDGRTYAPIGEIATILGIQKDWDSNTKTATFTN